MKKTLIIMHQSDYHLYKDFIKENEKYDIYMPYKNNSSNFITRIIRKIGVYRLNTWKDKIKNYEKTIIFDAAYKKRIVKYLKKNGIQVILWMWNPISKRQEKMLNDKNINSIYTYNQKDAKKYNIKYNSQFYFDGIKEYKNKKNTYDTYFLGLDKGRVSILDELKKEFKLADINYKIIIVNSEQEKMSYLDNIKNASKSKSIIELYNDTSNSGLTLRSLEAMVLNKKIITNNKSIKNYDIYNRKNVFIIGCDNIKNIKKFINSPNQVLDTRIEDYYSLSSWVDRF